MSSMLRNWRHMLSMLCKDKDELVMDMTAAPQTDDDMSWNKFMHTNSDKNY